MSDAAAYGGPSWPQRTAAMADELGAVWAPYRVRSEWRSLEAVLLHRPGPELEAVDEPDETLMLERPDPAGARRQHDAMAEAYRESGVEVHYVDPAETPPPNQMFCADLMFMTSAGVLLGRPASTVRAGEERWLARRLADLGVPILRSVGGTGTFEGADAAWLDPESVLVGRGLRTNSEGAAQVSEALEDLGAEAIEVDLPHGAMHLMGAIRIVDEDLAFVRRNRTPWSAVYALRDRGYEVRFFAGEHECRTMGHNFVTLGPRRILMPGGNPESAEIYRDAGVECVEVEMDEIMKGAGAVGCMTGILSRASAP